MSDTADPINRNINRTLKIYSFNPMCVSNGRREEICAAFKQRATSVFGLEGTRDQTVDECPAKHFKNMGGYHICIFGYHLTYGNRSTGVQRSFNQRLLGPRNIADIK